jgi:hypothetical protein
MNVRRLAAIDMWGRKGTLRRRRIILTEFLLGTIAGIAFGAWALGVQAGLGGLILGFWLIGIGLNYLPLAAYALRLSAADVLETELEGVDVERSCGATPYGRSGSSCRCRWCSSQPETS